MTLDLPEGETATAVTALVMYQVVERIRCVELATGSIVYEFWTDGKKAVRIDADAYEGALRVARQRMQFEPCVDGSVAAQQTGEPR